MSNFFPSDDYKLPVTSNYMKFQEGENNFRVLSSAITGWEYWNVEGKPIRSKEEFEYLPEGIKREKDGSFRVNHFWAFVVYNYNAKKIQILELTHKGIMGDVQNLVNSPKQGEPKEYDITFNRKGTGFSDTEYSVMPNPRSEIDSEIVMKYETLGIKLEALYDGEDPFKKE